MYLMHGVRKELSEGRFMTNPGLMKYCKELQAATLKSVVEAMRVIKGG